MTTTSNDTAKTPYRIKVFEGQVMNNWETMIQHPSGRVEWIKGGWATIKWMWALIKDHPEVELIWVKNDGTEERLI